MKDEVKKSCKNCAYHEGMRYMDKTCMNIDSENYGLITENFVVCEGWEEKQS